MKRTTSPSPAPPLRAFNPFAYRGPRGPEDPEAQELVKRFRELAAQLAEREAWAQRADLALVLNEEEN